MLGWAIGFFIAAAIAAAISYGVVATPFAETSRDVFWLLIALFGASLLFAVFGGKYGAPFKTSGRAFARLAFVAAVALSIYVWVDRNWSMQAAVGDEQLADNAATPVAVNAASNEDDSLLAEETPETSVDESATAASE